ncbi:MAG: hypothetical protein ACJA0K_000674 [Maricaulis maris]|jgi:hypothetical protein
MDERWSEQKRRQDLDDLNNESAGRDVGRISRFHHDRDPQTIEQKKREREARESALMRMMRDPAYVAAYQEAWDAIDRAQAALDAALLENAEEAERLAENIREMESRAARLPDGSLIFRAADGSIRGADGHRLRSDAVPASLIFPLEAPSYEDYAASRDALNSARAHGHDLSRIQTEVIDRAAARAGSETDPPTPEELRGIRDRMDTVAEHVAARDTAAVFAELDPAPEEPADIQHSDDLILDLPTLR